MSFSPGKFNFGKNQFIYVKVRECYYL